MENFSTTDLALAATLSYFGLFLLNTKKNFKGDIEFEFDNTPDLKQLVKSFSLGELTVEPRFFAVVLKDMKKVLYMQK